MMKMTKSLFLLLLSECCSFKLVFSNFHHIPLSKTYEEAKNYCRVMYTDLATINNLTDMANLIASVPNTTERAWIGLEMGDVPKWHWAWPHQKLDFFNFGEGEPQGLGQNSCAAMDLQGQWFESDCETKRSFVCQGNIDDTSNYIFVTNTKSWRDAQKHCRDLSMDLVGVGSAEENEEVQNVSTSQNVWIGLFRDAWKWSDGSESSFRYWKPHQPNSANQDCVAAVLKDEGRWNDLRCSTKRTFVCHGPSKVVPTSQTSTQETTTVTTPFNSSSSEVTLINSTAATSTQPLNTGGTSAFTTQPGTLTTTPASSESDLQLIAGNLILIRRNMTWTEALSYCREHHRDLVYITNPSTQNQVAEMTKNATSSHVWLGLRYTCNFNFWFWSSSPVHCYQNWAPGEGSEGAKWCGTNGAMETTGEQQWVGLPETQQLNFICQNCAG
ncbi:macrophage mannose receptor 1 isoform X2 [Dunckerocampus dactyliophorus]|uniref:macrophage mannose receptor 1 isoform X2 n=1 Tax=Dunckerocampus dactyliophorus TaxID=161453 RepID=UPI002405F7F4|nr:macrophage mannose receptor 1 isoform X2 [Dunckerocampus dactyliophorus]